MQNYTALYRLWQASIATNVNVPSIVVNSPLTVDFQIRKNITGQINQGNFRIYNLNPDTRKRIEFDRFLTSNASSINTSALPNQLYLPFSFYAGYNENSLAKMFEGNQQSAYTVAEEVERIVEIQCVDGMYGAINSIANLNIPTGATTGEAMLILLGALTRLQTGYVSSVSNVPLPNGYSFTGNIYQELRTLAKGDPKESKTFADCFIDNEKVYILGINEAFTSPRIVSFDANNIIGSPRVTGSYIEFDIVLEPNLRLGQIISLQTNYNQFINGQYKIIGLSHSGTISGAKPGRCVTTVQVFRPVNASLIPVFAYI